MRLNEFIHNYDLHDCFFESVEYDINRRVIVLTINFCFWRQKSYVSGTPENGIIRVEFQNVRQYSCDGGDPVGAFVGILGAEPTKNGIIIELLDDKANEHFEMLIISDNVEVSICN